MVVTSTVVDAAVCLLLVSGAVVVVTGATPDARDRGRGADAAVAALSTTTATLSFEREGRRVSRHATLSGHLAAATLARVEVDDRRVTGGRVGYVAAVRGAVESAVARETQVVAAWRPYPNAPLSARLTVGPSPPPGSDVHAETIRVSSGLRTLRNASDVESNASLGRRIADVVVAGLFPADELGYALDDPSVAPIVRDRYHRAGRALGVETPERPTSDDVRPLNDRFADALGARLTEHLERRAGGASAVNDETSAGTVVVTVRTWS